LRVIPHADKLSDDALRALKIAFTYTPRQIELNKFEYGEKYELVPEHNETVHEMLLLNDTNPDEVYDDIDSSPNSSY